jgi:hypothetical protein
LQPPSPHNTRSGGLFEEVTMKRQSFLFVCTVIVVAYVLGGHARVPQASASAESAAKASPELVSALSKEIGGTPAQAAGAAGALFGVAKSRLNPDQFSQIAAAVPGMDSLLSAASVPTGGATDALTKAAGSASGLGAAANAFTKLGLKPDMVGKAVPVLTSFVTKSGGADVGKMLAGALK